jgi:hypothetical protein
MLNSNGPNGVVHSNMEAAFREDHFDINQVDIKVTADALA